MYGSTDPLACAGWSRDKITEGLHGHVIIDRVPNEHINFKSGSIATNDGINILMTSCRAKMAL